MTQVLRRKVRGWIAEKSPEQLKLPFALWTARAVLELIERRLDIRLGLSTVQLYLRPILSEALGHDAAKAVVAGAETLARRDRGLPRVCGRWAYLGRIWPSPIRQVIEVTWTPPETSPIGR